MALIKCPECGNAVSTAADACPHCGYPIKRTMKPKVEDKSIVVFPKPKNPAWVGKWKKKARANRWKWTLLFLASVLLLIVSFIILNTDKKVTSYGEYLRERWIVLVWITSLITFIMLIIWILALLTIRVRTRQYDGYTILMYLSFKHHLVVEDKIQDSGIVNRYLYGQLPNKKQVWVNISAWDGSVKMGIGKEGDEKNLI